MLYVWHPSGHPCSPCAAPRTQHRAFFSECLFQGYKGRCAARGSVCGLRPAVTARLVFHCCKKLLKIKKKKRRSCRSRGSAPRAGLGSQLQLQPSAGQPMGPIPAHSPAPGGGAGGGCGMGPGLLELRGAVLDSCGDSVGLGNSREREQLLPVLSRALPGR